MTGMTNESLSPLLWLYVNAGLLAKEMLERAGLYLENAYQRRTRRLPYELLAEAGLLRNTPESVDQAQKITLDWLKSSDAQELGLHLHFGSESGMMQKLALERMPQKALQEATVSERQSNLAALQAAISDFGRGIAKSSKTLTTISTPPRGIKLA